MYFNNCKRDLKDKNNVKNINNILFLCIIIKILGKYR